MNKNTKISDLRQYLAKGEVSLGGWMQITSPEIAEVMGNSRLDWVAVDLEHGSIGIPDLPNIFRALELHDTLPFVRIAGNYPSQAIRALEAGAAGIIIPNVQCSNEVENIWQSINYPPEGKRGVGFNRSNCYGVNFDPDLQQKPLLVAMIETKRGVSALDIIVRGHLTEANRVDAILIGPYDLSASLGCTNQFDHPDFLNAIHTIEEICKQYNIPLGVHVVQPHLDKLEEVMKKGYTFIPYGTDATFLSSSIQCAIKYADHR